MRTSAKKSKSHQAFEAVFDEQARRFSAFDLLGLTPQAPSASHESGSPTTAWLKPTAGFELPAIEPRLADHELEEQSINSQTQALGSDPQIQDLRSDREIEALRSDRQRKVLRSDLSRDLTVRPKHLGLTVGPGLGLTVGSTLGPTGGELRSDGQIQVTPQLREEILLSPIQWKVWLALQEAETNGLTISYHKIAKQIQCRDPSVKKAVNIIQKEGGILSKAVIRTAEEQGFRVVLNRDVAFRCGTLNEAKGVLKRGLSLGPTGGGQIQALGSDGLRMFVCIYNKNIRQTDMALLLRMSPPEWKVREQTLVQIADALPNMTAIEFRLSLAHLIEQAKSAKEPIRNPNAWVKAAFEKNGGPLVTEREIEARFEQSSLRREPQKPRGVGEGGTSDVELLQRYLACEPHERAEIDRMAAEKSAPLLRIVSEDKRAGVLNEARLEALRDFFAKQP